MVRCKMTLSSMEETHYGKHTATIKKLRFHCTYDPTVPEDQRFQKATPSGSAEFTVDNPAALEQLEIGRSYYVDFTPAPTS